MTSWNVGISNSPSSAVFCGRTSGSRSFARSVFSSASVKSNVNHVFGKTVLSIVTVLLRLANSGWSATFVVPPMSGSWRATSWPSFVNTRSGSM